MSSSRPHPTPPHPSSCAASTMCSSPKNVIIPNPPHIHHVFKFKECHHPRPTPPQQLRSIHHVCVASTICSSSKSVIIPTPPHPTPAVAQHPPCVQVQRMSSWANVRVGADMIFSTVRFQESSSDLSHSFLLEDHNSVYQRRRCALSWILKASQNLR